MHHKAHRPRNLGATLLVALLALVVLPAQDAQAALVQATQAAPQVGHVIEDGQVQVVEAFADSTTWIREQLWVETSFDSDGDGRPDRMHVTVVRPAQTETEGFRVPVIYETSPYFGGSASVGDILWDVEHDLGEASPTPREQPYVEHRPDRERISNSHVNNWVPRGFAVVHSESPGTGLSEGCPTMGGANESLAPKAVIDWLNGRARAFTSRDGNEEVTAHWSTGRVGMTGTSFNGTLPLAAATTGVEGLEAIIPIAPNTSYWHYYRSHGLIRSPGGYLGEDIDGLYDYVFSGYPEVRDYCNSTVRVEMVEQMDRITGNWNDFWAERDYALQIGNVRAAVLMAHAWNDWNVMPEHSVRVIEAMKEHGVPHQMYFHQGGHGGAPPPEMMNRWFTRYLLDVENGVEDEPLAWIVREDDPRDEPTPYPDYPHPDAEPVTLFPHGDGIYQASLLHHGPSESSPQTLRDNVEFSGAELAQAEKSRNRLLFLTEELSHDLHISGTAEITLEMTASRPLANLSVWLVALPWTDPEARQPNFSVITRGWADPTNHRSLIETDPIVPGEYRTVSFTLQPTDQVIPAGRQIGLMVFSSDREFTLWPPPGTELTVELAGTTLTLPVVGGSAALEGALSGH